MNPPHMGIGKGLSGMDQALPLKGVGHAQMTGPGLYDGSQAGWACGRPETNGAPGPHGGLLPVLHGGEFWYGGLGWYGRLGHKMGCNRAAEWMHVVGQTCLASLTCVAGRAYMYGRARATAGSLLGPTLIGGQAHSWQAGPMNSRCSLYGWQWLDRCDGPVWYGRGKPGLSGGSGQYVPTLGQTCSRPV